MTVAAGDVHVATEVTDEAFVRALERWSRVAAMGAPEGWVYRVAVNLLRRRWRRAAVERRVLGRVAADRPHAPGAEPDLSPELWAAVRALPPRARQAVALRYVAGLSEAEVAAAMGVRVGTVASCLHGARRRLTDLLSPVHEEAT